MVNEEGLKGDFTPLQQWPVAAGAKLQEGAASALERLQQRHPEPRGKRGSLCCFLLTSIAML